ncbi:MAG: BACON domain-containing carbohydrate-binding protein [Vicinamibacterales bacterium]
MFQTPLLLIRIALLSTGIVSGIAATAQASGFVYTAVPAVPCAVEAPCAAPYVLVVDADTVKPVIRLPLPVHTTPAGIALSSDGAHLYVSNAAAELSGVTSMTVIDARRHGVVGTYPLPTGDSGLLAVRGDDTKVFIGTRASRLSVFDTGTHTLSLSVPLAGPFVVSMAVHTALDRLFVLEGYGVPGGAIDSFDAGTLARLGGIPGDGSRVSVTMYLTRDERELRVLRGTSIARPTIGGQWLTIEPDTFTIVSSGFGEYRPGPHGDVPTTDERLAGLSEGYLDRGTLADVLLPGRPLALTIPNERRAFVTTAVLFPSAGRPGAETLTAVDLTANAVVGTLPLSPAASSLLTSTPQGAQACAYRLDTHDSSFAVWGGTATLRLTTGCDWDVTSSEPWVHLSVEHGAGSGLVTVTVDPHVLPTPRTAQITIGGQTVTVTQAGGVSDGPFGTVDTPVDGTTGVSGALAVTGWALDDVGVTGVRVYRNPLPGEGSNLIYLGAATLVDGARPDVAAFLPQLPFATRAGWGLMVLTNSLPNAGTGTYRLWAYADDVEGHTSFLGTKVFSSANGAATKPFGAIDTPGPGETVSGTVVNFGWALTPSPGAIPTDGSTIDVLVDGQSLGHPVYGIARADIAELFPGYANSAGAVGYFVLDTTTLANGLHTIAWVVRDDQGRAEGIGSRYFRVFNP